MIAVRITPRARRNALRCGEDGIRIAVTAIPEDGKATEAARRLLAEAVGIAPTRLELVRGASSRDKLFRVLAP